MIMIGFASGLYIISLMSYLELQNKFFCSDDSSFTITYKCEPHHNDKTHVPGFCENETIHHRVNWTDPTSLNNWYTQLDLACVNKARVGLIGSSLFIGWSIAAFISPRLADIYGRR